VPAGNGSTPDKLDPSPVNFPEPVRVILEFDVMAPVMAPPDLGKAALAVVFAVFAVLVVEVNTASLTDTSTPSTVPATVTFPVNEGDANGAFASREVCRLVTFAIVCVCAVGANVVDARRASLTLVSAIGYFLFPVFVCHASVK
jgi:hypothetical protein